VENAIKHGVSVRPGAGCVTISAARTGNVLRLRVHNDGPSPEVDAPFRSGVGVRNTRERLSQLYGDEGRLALGPAAEGGFVAEIVLPYRTGQSGPADPAERNADAG